jgi:hypothetical protein
MPWDFNKGHLERVVETYIFERKKEMESAFLCEIQKIGTENGIETKIILNESKIVDALKNCQEGYKGIKAEVARTFRKRMNEKMGKHTHLLGKEYVQRIMREIEKELTEEK